MKIHKDFKDKKKIKEWNNRQGRTEKQYENSVKLAWYSVIGMVILLIIVVLLGY